MSRHDKIYDLADCYDIAFSYRNYQSECDFLVECFSHLAGRAPVSFLELAAGPARHALEMCRRGIRGIAIDCAQPMVDFGFRLARAENLALDYRREDMTDFTLDDPVDFAAILIDSASYLLDNDAVVRHFRSVARALTEDGVYILEMSHPLDVFRIRKTTLDDWTTERQGRKIRFQWGLPEDHFDPMSQVTRTTVMLEIEEEGIFSRIVDSAPQRCFSPNEFSALVDLSGEFTLVHRYGAFDRTIPPNHPKAWRLITVLKKK